MRIIHPRPELGRQTAFDVEFTDGVAHVDALHPERELAMQQHGFTLITEIEGVKLEDLTVSELLEIADQEGVDVPARAKKADVIAALEAAPVPVLGEDD